MLTKEQFSDIWMGLYLEEPDSEFIKVLEKELSDNVGHVKSVFHADRSFPSGLKSLVLLMLRVNPTERVSMEKVLSSAWLGLKPGKTHEKLSHNRRSSDTMLISHNLLPLMNGASSSEISVSRRASMKPVSQLPTLHS